MLIKRNAVSLIISQQKNVSINCGKFIKIAIKIKYKIFYNLSEVLFREITTVFAFITKKTNFTRFYNGRTQRKFANKKGKIAFPPKFTIFPL